MHSLLRQKPHKPYPSQHCEMINKALRQLREENINIPIFESFHCDAFGTMQTLGAAFTHEQTGRGF